MARTPKKLTKSMSISFETGDGIEVWAYVTVHAPSHVLQRSEIDSLASQLASNAMRSIEAAPYLGACICDIKVS